MSCRTRSGIQFRFLDSGACPGLDPGFAGMTTRGKLLRIKPTGIKPCGYYRAHLL